MDNPIQLIFLFLAAFAFSIQSQSAHSYQNLAIATGEPDFFRNPVTNFNSVRFAANDPIYNPSNRTVTVTRPYNVVGLDGKTYQATITKTAAADIPKVGAALSKFAQRVGPVSMALATADLICTLSNICKDASNWVLNPDPSTSGYPSSTNEIAYYCTNGCTSLSGNDQKSPDPTTSCKKSISFLSGYEYVSNTTSQCTMRYVSTGYTGAYTIVRVASYCATGYTVSGSGCVASFQTNSQPVTSSDWTAAETKLSTNSAADRLAAELEPLPVQAPLPFAPLNVPLGTSTATNKDPAGNAVGTQTTTRRLDIEDAATEAEPYRVTVKETDTVTNYDVNNQPISSTETVKQDSTQSEPPPPQDVDVEFDQSTDRDLQNYEVPGLFSYTPFGGAGSCPQDVTENTKFGNVTMSYAPVCEVAEGVRPFVILLAIISAFFIVSGSRKS